MSESFTSPTLSAMLVLFPGIPCPPWMTLKASVGVRGGVSHVRSEGIQITYWILHERHQSLLCSFVLILELRENHFCDQEVSVKYTGCQDCTIPLNLLVSVYT